VCEVPESRYVRGNWSSRMAQRCHSPNRALDPFRNCSQISSQSKTHCFELLYLFDSSVQLLLRPIEPYLPAYTVARKEAAQITGVDYRNATFFHFSDIRQMNDRGYSGIQA
jgi:hypothetical protein